MSTGHEEKKTKKIKKIDNYDEQS